MSIINAIESRDQAAFATMLREIYRRAMTDPSFRETALKDAEAAFESVGGTLGDWNIKFVDSREGVDDVFMLPPAIETAPELTEQELDAVSGGATDGGGSLEVGGEGPELEAGYDSLS